MTILARLKALLFLALLAAPLLLTLVPVLHPDLLRGYEEAAVRAPLQAGTWWAGKFQEALEPWYAQRLGVRPWLVRTDNQLALTLFGETRGRTPVVFGRDNWLFEGVYLDKYARPDRTAPEKLAQAVSELSRLRDLLAERGVPLVVLIAPSKAEVYPELLPPGTDAGRAERRTAYDRLAPLLEAAGLDLLDMHRLFIEERLRGERTPLFPQGGTHWNHYGNAFVAQRILDLLERRHPGRFVRIELTGSRTDRRVQPPDDDIAGLLNIWFPGPYLGPQTHPVFTRAEEGRALPRLLFTGDSFVLSIMEFLAQERLMQPSEAIYYFRERWRYPGPEVGPFDPKRLDMAREVEGVDAVVIVSSEYWLPDFAFGFVPAAIRSLERAGRGGPPPAKR